MTVGLYHGVGTRNLGCSFGSTNISVNSLKRISSRECWNTVLGNSDSDSL